ncbi:unnamed protein product [Phytomonas sp. Hart1]|nr:unnamed protein product [Phytomonas sp. Hart1]|eukprot:CCW68384.1 unnamed protein product [Phytomonas sp. isolate Hart1]
MNIPLRKKLFERAFEYSESVLVTFKGVDGWDVYNCSVPFLWKGKRHIYGRVEKREEWASSHVSPFVETGKDEYTALPGCSWSLEDPFIQKINEEFILGGTHVVKKGQTIVSYCGYFFRGPSPTELRFFASGPKNMKDIRLVQLASGKVGVFSRPREAYKANVGFVVLDHIDELNEEAVKRATPLDLFEDGTWGGVNQAYLLSSGKVGCIAHYSFRNTDQPHNPLLVYVNFSFVLDPQTLAVSGSKIIGTRSCYPLCAAKRDYLIDCVFTSGIVMRPDGRCDLYSGIGDTHEGRIVIDYPFRNDGKIVNDLCAAQTQSSL